MQTTVPHWASLVQAPSFSQRKGLNGRGLTTVNTWPRSSQKFHSLVRANYGTGRAIMGNAGHPSHRSVWKRICDKLHGTKEARVLMFGRLASYRYSSCSHRYCCLQWDIDFLQDLMLQGRRLCCTDLSLADVSLQSRPLVSRAKNSAPLCRIGAKDLYMYIRQGDSQLFPN